MPTKKPTKTWMEQAEALRADLDRVTKRLDALAKRAVSVKAMSEPVSGASEGARWEARRTMDDVARAAERASGAAERVALAANPRSEREVAERKLEEAERVLRADYYADVRGVAEEFIEKWRDGEFGSCDEAIEWIDQSVDGHERVIYTGQAMQCLRYSDNDGAYVDDFGTDGIVDDDGVCWSKLAYAAFRADIMDRIGAEDDVDTNYDPPKKVTGHEHVLAEDEQLEAIEEAVGECEGDYPCAHRDEDGEFDCGKSKRLHGRK